MIIYDQSDAEIFEVLQAAEDVAERLRALTGSLGPDFFSTQFYTRIRVKTYPSIIQKLHKKRWEASPNPGSHLPSTSAAVSEPYSFHRMTDLVGFRIVTLYDDDIGRAIEHLLNFIRASSSFAEALFVPLNPPPQGVALDAWDFVREAIFFRRPMIEDENDVYASLYEEYKQKFENRFGTNRGLLKHYSNKLKLRKPVEGDYSSAHFVLNARGKVRSSIVDIPVEVQIRTASEDIWGEINHKLYYKAKDSYVWTPKLQETYDEMEYWSHKTKMTLDEVREPITAFWRKSRVAERLVEEFREPEVPYHRSLIVTLLYAISKDHLGGAEEKIRKYDEALKRLEGNIGALNSLKVLHECSRLMTEVSSEFRKVRDRIASSGREDKPLILAMLQQREILCAIELVRLDAVAVFHYGHLLSEDGTAHRLTRRTRPMQLRRVFDAMCEHRNDAALKLRPVAMLSYWKALISKQIDPVLGMHHLRVAASELQDDKSLPNWSIYHINIRRSLASQLYGEAYRLYRANGNRSSSQVFWRSQLAMTMQNMLEQAFRLVLESHNRKQIKDERAGDLLFGYRSDEELIDAGMLAGIASWYLHLFGKLDCKRLGTSFGFLIDRFTEVRDSHDKLSTLRSVDPTGRIKLINRLNKDIEILTRFAQD